MRKPSQYADRRSAFKIVLDFVAHSGYYGFMKWHYNLKADQIHGDFVIFNGIIMEYGSNTLLKKMESKYG